LTYDLDLDKVKVNQHAKYMYLGQSHLVQKLLFRYTDKHTHILDWMFYMDSYKWLVMADNWASTLSQSAMVQCCGIMLLQPPTAVMKGLIVSW